MGQQDLRDDEIEDGDGRAYDGDVAASEWAIVVRVPNDEECEQSTEQRCEEGEQQHDQPGHRQVSDIVGEARELDLRSPLPGRGARAAVSIEIGTALRAHGSERVDRLSALWTAVRARHRSAR
jgi:hypothetical protein